ncbi:hypothetical protein NQ317_016933 [Molorchus minor]|uniref:Uncharacterized protein n=1 Tax=Molorchus minor TaxID=1323400 RepID=A0ABQ9K4T8_9CUCU|nr:hypothetical protein NQ317_016933 [Molorchus minor]
MSDSSDMSLNSTPPDIRQEANETYDTLLPSKSKSKYETCYKNYPKLCSFLKLKSTGYKTKKSKIVTPEQIKHFLLKAPDREYLFTKWVVEKIYCTTRTDCPYRTQTIEHSAYGVVLNSRYRAIWTSYPLLLHKLLLQFNIFKAFGTDITFLVCLKLPNLNLPPREEL